jgi:hypothetical protein
MLQRETGEGKPLVLRGFLVGVEMERDGNTTAQEVMYRIDDGLTWMESIGKVEVSDLGEIEVISE